MSRRRQLAGWLLLLAPLAYLCIFLVVPLALLLVTSLHPYSATHGVGPGWTLENYRAFLTSRFDLGVLFETLKISLVTTLCCLVLGYPVAFYLSQSSGRRRRVITLLLLSPLLVSMVIRAYGWVIVLGSTGPIAGLFRALGLHAPVMLYNEFAVVLGMVHVLLAYMVIAISASLDAIDVGVVRAARNLGASPWQAFRRVVLPLSAPGVLAGSVIVFSITSSSFVTPAILGGSRVKLMSYLTYDNVTSVLNWPFGSAIGFILIAVTTGILLLYGTLARRGAPEAIFQ
ncbi:MAG TPA: ABC transporter permease [Candidatus Dormibacteraeota bacterium]|nr:ABC transporter permease [Candidatus Dormibacteraeota bacterium]